MWKDPGARLSGSLARRLAGSGMLPGVLRSGAEKHWEQVCREFSALTNVSMEVEQGETVGIIGHNGSGKSTLLKIISGTLQPTKGQVEVRGKVGALLELAAGFDPEFTGRENVFLSGAIHGLSRAEVQERMPGIEDFAEIGDFIDQPVKTYSSGMLVRLAFAVHSSMDPEILIVDEALAVGDEPFRRKCFARLERIREQGTTFLFVSHDMGAMINLTERVFWLHHGEVLMAGDPKQVVSQYQRYSHAPGAHRVAILKEVRELAASEAAASQKEQTGEAGRPAEEPKSADSVAFGEAYEPGLVPKSTVSYDEQGARIHNVRILNEKGEIVNLLRRRQYYTYEYLVAFEQTCLDVCFAMLIKQMDGVELGGARSHPIHHFITEINPGRIYRVAFRFCCLLAPGVYFMNAGVEGLVDDRRSYVHRLLDAVVFRVLPEGTGKLTATVDFLVEPDVRLWEEGRP